MDKKDQCTLQLSAIHTMNKIKYDNKTILGLEFDIISLTKLYQKELDHLLTHPQQVEFYIILLITEGRGFHLVDFKKYSYHRGTIFTIGKNQIQQFSGYKKSKGYILLFTENFINKCFEKKETFQSLLQFDDALVKPVFNLLKKQFEDISNVVLSLNAEYHNNYNDNFKEGILRSVLHTLLMKLERYKNLNKVNFETRRNYDQFIDFKAAVHEHCFASRAVSYYANQLRSSSKKLNCITQSFVNKSAKDFIHEIFLLKVKRMYINTNLSTKEISYRCGFDEPTNFIKYFKKHAGILPSDFKLAYR